MPTYKFSAQGQSLIISGGWLYSVCCEQCDADLGPAMEGFGPPIVRGLDLDEVVSRLLKQEPPDKDTANTIRHHELRCPGMMRRAVGG